jgi:peroxiredoxin
MEIRRLLVCGSALALIGGGPPAPIELQTLDGADIELARGELPPDLVLHFWATWCPECVEELPDLEQAAKACDPARVRVIAINSGEDAERVRRYIAEHALAIPVLLDSSGKAWRKAGLWGLPSNLVWTAEGQSTSAGPTSPKLWRQRLAGLGCDGAAPPVDPPEPP